MSIIGVLKEPDNDNRVCILPETVKKITSRGIDVMIEVNAGEGLGISNYKYQEAGALCATAENIYSQAELVCSINHRYQNEALTSHINFLGIYNPLYHTKKLEIYTESASVYSLDLLPRSTLAQNMDVLSSMASLAGYKAVIIASNISSSCLPMFTTAAGTIKPARILVLGAGVAGLQAIATARRMGAVVEAFDVRRSAGEEVRSLGAKFIDVDGGVESHSAGGYAISQSEEYQERQKRLIHNSAIQADIIIATANIPGKKAPVLIERKTITEMKKGAVIIDLASEQGGNCEMSQDNTTIEYEGITIIGNSHLSKLIPLASSQLLSNNYYNYINLFINDRGHDLIKASQVIEKGEIVHPKVQMFNHTI